MHPVHHSSSKSLQKEEEEPNLLIWPFAGIGATAGDVAGDVWAPAIRVRLPSLHVLRIGYDTARLFPLPPPFFFSWRAQPQFLWYGRRSITESKLDMQPQRRNPSAAPVAIIATVESRNIAARNFAFLRRSRPS